MSHNEKRVPAPWTPVNPAANKRMGYQHEGAEAMVSCIGKRPTRLDTEVNPESLWAKPSLLTSLNNERHAARAELLFDHAQVPHHFDFPLPNPEAFVAVIVLLNLFTARKAKPNLTCVKMGDSLAMTPFNGRIEWVKELRNTPRNTITLVVAEPGDGTRPARWYQ